jgi:hypothetical protein
VTQFITDSSKTINDELSSRNLEHIKAISELKELLGDKVLILDREFSYELLFENMLIEGIKFVIRLNVGNNPTITNENGDKISLTINPGDEVNIRGVYYKGKLELNIDKIMNQKQDNMEKMLSMVLLSYSIGLLIGETIRESVYTEKKRKLYSGLHILLKHKVNVFDETLETIINSAFLVFSNIVLGNVRTYV